MDRQCQRGSVSKRKRCITGIGMCKRQRWGKFVHAAPSSVTYIGEDRRVREEEKKDVILSV